MIRLFKHKELLLLVLILIISVFSITGISMYLTYQRAKDNMENTLTEKVNILRKQIITFKQFNISETEILSFIRQLNTSGLRIGKQGEYAIAEIKGDSIHFLFSSFHPDSAIFIPQKAIKGGPMRMALAKKKGFIKSYDYQGEMVYSAYAYVPETCWGVVAKIPTSQFNQPYFINAIVTLILACLLLILCVYLYYRISSPLIKGIMNREEHFRALFENNQNVMLLLDPENGEIIDANPAAAAFYGYSISQLISMKISDINIMSPDEIKDKLSIAKSNRQNYFEVKHKLANGDIRDVAVYSGIIAVRDQKYLYSQIQDVTEHKLIENENNEKQLFIQTQNEEYATLNEEYKTLNEELNVAKDAIEESFKNFRLLFDNMSNGFSLHEIVWNNSHPVDFRYLMVNKAFEEIMQIHEADILGKKVSEITSGLAPEMIDRFIKVAITGDPDQFQYYSQSFNKHLRVYAYSPRPNQFAAIFEDISDVELNKEARTQMADALDASLHEIYIYDAQTLHFTYVNYGALKNLGYSHEMIERMTPLDLKPDFTPEMFSELVKPLRNGSIPKIVYETHHRRANSTMYPIEVNLQLINSKSGSVFLAIIQDITKRKENEYELLKAKEKAEESDRMKTVFLQNMSHEIRTPMNAIMGFAELIPRYIDDKPKLEYFASIMSQRSMDLLDIINELLDVAKIESGNVSLHLSECKISSLFDELNEFFVAYQQKINKEHIEFSVLPFCDPENSIILTDGVKLKQIFINLINNSFKFSTKGKIEVGCQINRNNELVFYVSDTGIGIPKEKYDIVFQRFTQLEDSHTRNYGGTGLGLSIVKGLIDVLKGNIWFESEVGKGTTFYFSIPCDKVKVAGSVLEKQAEIGLSTIQNRSILIVEDDLFNAELLNETLNETGFKIMLATNGKECMELVAEHHFDIILMDIRLPDATGDELTRKIKLKYPQTIIIAQTAYASVADQQRFIEAGCDEYISKPIKRAMLLEKIYKHLKT